MMQSAGNGPDSLTNKWKTWEIRFRLVTDNVLESINRKIKHTSSISIRKHFFKAFLPTTEQTQKIINSLITDNQPFAVIRFGLYEAMLCKQFLEKQNCLRDHYSDFIRKHIDVDAGMFTNDDNGLDQYATYVISMLPSADVIAYWSNIPSKLVFAPFYKKSCQHIWVEDLYPFPFWHERMLPTWQLALQGKRVLIVSAFADTVKKQYTKRTTIWKSPDILPDFELMVYKAVQTSAGSRDKRFSTWLDAFNHMRDELKELDFDIALISCGSYGTPLALALKQEGKSVIQWGGCFQLWFGINGKRWSMDEKIQAYTNTDWCFASDEETPVNYGLVDNGSYWRT